MRFRCAWLMETSDEHRRNCVLAMAINLHLLPTSRALLAPGSTDLHSFMISSCGAQRGRIWFLIFYYFIHKKAHQARACPALSWRDILAETETEHQKPLVDFIRLSCGLRQLQRQLLPNSSRRAAVRCCSSTLVASSGALFASLNFSSI